MSRTLVLASLLLLLACSSPTGGKNDQQPPPDDGVFHVAIDGSDFSGDGTADSPWRTIGHAAATIPVAGDFTILVHPGSYEGPIEILRGFEKEVTIKSEQDYGAILSHVNGNETILFVSHQGPARLGFEGFVISNEGTTRNPCSSPAGHMIHLTNVSDVTFRNNIIYGNNRMPRCNEAIKINLDNASTFPTGIRFEGNLLSSPPAVDGREMIDIFEPGELDFVDNIFVSNRGAGAGEAFIKLWGEWGSTTARSPRYHIARNVFINYEGNSSRGFLEFGGEGTSIYEISDALIENNLFIGSSTWPMAAPLVFRGVQGVNIRANTFVGRFVAGALALRVGTDGSNPTSRAVSLVNNIWSDPGGTQPDTFLSIFGDVDVPSLSLDNNVFWNGGAALPALGAMTPADDANRFEADPLIATDPVDPILPRWDVVNGVFASGSQSVREEFERLVALYGAIGAGSSARGAASPAQMPATDILGLDRDGSPDVGAFEGR
jgi:hypothetical protein